eukprot:7799127-Alexandrium_andersonii.AAC.1
MSRRRNPLWEGWISPAGIIRGVADAQHAASTTTRCDFQTASSTFNQFRASFGCRNPLRPPGMFRIYQKPPRAVPGRSKHPKGTRGVQCLAVVTPPSVTSIARIKGSEQCSEGWAVLLFIVGLGITMA